MRYQFLIDTYETERLKVLSVWSMFRDEDLLARPDATDKRGRNLLEHMVHQCVSENNWFSGMLGIDVSSPPLPKGETRLGFIEHYAEDSLKRLAALRGCSENWWEEETTFFDVPEAVPGSSSAASPTPRIIADSRPHCCEFWAATCTATTAPRRIPAASHQTARALSMRIRMRRRFSMAKHTADGSPRCRDQDRSRRPGRP